MNILFQTFQGDIAGSTNSISYLAKGLAEKGHNVYLGCRKESLLYKLVEGTRVKRIPMVFRSKIDFQNIRHTRDIVKEYNIQIINAQSSWDRYSTIFAKWLYKLPVKLVHTRRQKPESIGGWLQNWFYVKGTEKIIVISEELKKMFIEIGIPSNHIHVIYNGIPKERFNIVDDRVVQNLRNKFGLKENDIVIGCISRLKNQEQIIRALPYLDPAYKVLFVGIEPGYFDKLTNYLNVKNQIIYAGFVSGDEVLNFYKLLNVSILASSMDGFGLVLLEAMALGIPVIATNFGGIKNVVQDGYNGLLFEDNDIEELAKKIQLALSETSLRDTLIKNGKKTAFETFTMERTVEKYEQFFQNLIETNNGHIS